MDQIAAWSQQDRQDLFTETAKRRKLLPAIIEKDFWVCWTLKQVFSLPMAPHLLFKGGTSLSKVYKVINRFSEDIDLSVHRDYLGFCGENDPMQLPSVSKREAQIEKLVQACTENIRDEFVPQLSASFQTILGSGHGADSGTPLAVDSSEIHWRLDLDPNDPQTVLFIYPNVTTPSAAGVLAASYVAPVVRLEMGARSDPYPTGTHDIISYAAEEYPYLFLIPTCAVHVLEAQRTFWEKATILHAEYHRPESTRPMGRLSRHYYDLAQLASSDITETALADMSLLARVATHKKVFFRSGWAKYDEARPGSLRLVPLASKQDALRRDYAGMSEMFFDERPTFDYIIQVLQILEDRINSQETSL